MRRWVLIDTDEFRKPTIKIFHFGKEAGPRFPSQHFIQAVSAFPKSSGLELWKVGNIADVFSIFPQTFDPKAHVPEPETNSSLHKHTEEDDACVLPASCGSFGGLCLVFRVSPVIGQFFYAPFRTSSACLHSKPITSSATFSSFLLNAVTYGPVLYLLSAMQLS